jgi:SAM-dependent methyltransferase
MLYNELARYYDYVYDWKDYAADVRRLEDLISQYKRSSGNTLLDIGCGTGSHLKLLEGTFSCTGIDVSEPMLEIAREKLKRTTLIQDDMLTFDLGRGFDVAVSLFSTIGYANTIDELTAVAGRISAHLVDGGITVIEPWLRKEDIKPSYVGMNTYDSEELRISRMGRLVIEEDISIFEAHYLIAEGGEVRYLVDSHRLGLFGEDDIVGCLEAAGLKAFFVEDGFEQDRGVIIGIKE